jgi:(1->4)-alpha-D-glucan 1-alpha-D-glucosylmutase
VLGEAAEHLIAYDRGGAIALATRLPLGLARRGGWGDTEIVLAGREVVDVITGRRFPGGETRVADLLAVHPVALLAPAEVLDR